MAGRRGAVDCSPEVQAGAPLSATAGHAHADYPPPRCSRRSVGNGAHRAGAGYDTESDSDKEQERGESESDSRPRAAPADKAAAAHGPCGTSIEGGGPAGACAGHAAGAYAGPGGARQDPRSAPVVEPCAAPAVVVEPPAVVVVEPPAVVVVEPVPVRPTLGFPSPGGPGLGSDSCSGGEVAVVAQAYAVPVSGDAGLDGRLDLEALVRAYPLAPATQPHATPAVAAAEPEQQAAQAEKGAAAPEDGAGGALAGTGWRDVAGMGCKDMDDGLERVLQQEARLRDECAAFLDAFGYAPYPAQACSSGMPESIQHLSESSTLPSIRAGALTRPCTYRIPPVAVHPSVSTAGCRHVLAGAAGGSNATPQGAASLVAHTPQGALGAQSMP